jgi:phosphoglycolate phosphatase
MKKRLILFDLDWTLIYSGGAGVRALDRAFEMRHGVPNAMAQVSVDGKTDPAICREMIQVLLKRPAVQAEVDAGARQRGPGVGRLQNPAGRSGAARTVKK